ncbi:MAG: glycosyl hydrolase family 32 [Dermatophilaceae bacterium]
MLRLPDSWVWDAWYVQDEETYHVFFLYASRALHDPALRHRNAGIGHAISTDLVTWERVEDALVSGPPGAFDDVATWTGSVVRGDDGRWYMFYTGTTDDGRGALIQQIGLATSDDLCVWHKHPANPVLRADPRWYELVGGVGEWQDEHWRDPWVIRDIDGGGWHMLITARARAGCWEGRGVIGHATSPDLLTWTAREPLSQPNSDLGFGFLEVPQVVDVDGRQMLIVNCPAHQMNPRRSGIRRGGIWVASADASMGPYDLSNATLLADERLYVGKLVQDPIGAWVLLAFVNTNDAAFGQLTDPIPVRWVGEVLTADVTAREAASRSGEPARREPPPRAG